MQDVFQHATKRPPKRHNGKTMVAMLYGNIEIFERVEIWPKFL